MTLVHVSGEVAFLSLVQVVRQPDTLVASVVPIAFFSVMNFVLFRHELSELDDPYTFDPLDVLSLHLLKQRERETLCLSRCNVSKLNLVCGFISPP